VVIVEPRFDLCFSVGVESCMSNWFRLDRMEGLMFVQPVDEPSLGREW
jgi:hypothetical protein